MINPDVVFDFEINGNGPSFAGNWAIPGDLPYFEGHFPDGAVLPGVAILDASLTAIKRAERDSSLRLTGVKNAKFLQLVRPGMNVRMDLTKTGDATWAVQWHSVAAGTDAKVLLVELSLHTGRG
ncbi:MAG TPA: hypothetical protein VFV50_05240 [Bdellovibrionales bacterium]|nr:hypothetical protein [Bdellovibrionales bacterium]